jgi:hypothetical protein
MKLTMRSIRNYLPDPVRKERDSIVQARISHKTKENLKKIASDNSWTESEVIRGLIQKFVDDQLSGRRAS